MLILMEYDFSGCDSPRSSRSSVCPAVLLQVLVLSLAPQPCPEEEEAVPLWSLLFPHICVSESSGAAVFQPPGSSGRWKCGKWDQEAEENTET